jgi:hypothetical protein
MTVYRSSVTRAGKVIIAPNPRLAVRHARGVFLWPLGDEPRQLELVAKAVAPQLVGN